MSRKRKIGISIAALVAVLILAICGYIAYFALGNKALPGTYVGSTNVSGLTEQEIQQRLDLGAKRYTVNITGDGITATKAKLTDMGYSLDSQRVAKQALAANDVWWKYFTVPFSKNSVQPNLTIDEKKAADFAKQLTANNEKAVAPVDPCLEFADSAFVIKAGKDGIGVDVAKLKQPATQLVATLQNVDYQAKIEKIAPLLKEEQLKEQQTLANKLIAPEVTVTYKDATVTATPAEKSAWINLTGAKPTIDSAQVQKWVQTKGDTFKVEGTTGLRYVDSSGKVLLVKQEAVADVTVNNVPAVTKDILATLKSGSAAKAEFTTTTAEPKWENKKIAAGAEKLVYPAAEGEHWAEVDVSNNWVRLWNGATSAGFFEMVPGAPNTPTRKGTFKVWTQVRSQTMKGDDFELPNVRWVSYFDRGIGFHSAYWRHNFGPSVSRYSGSHGCINMREQDAKQVYDFLKVGSTVVVHG